MIISKLFLRIILIDVLDAEGIQLKLVKNKTHPNDFLDFTDCVK